MFGCLGRLGCLVLIVLAAAVGWLTQDSWLPKLKVRVMSSEPRATASAAKWEPLTPAGADRARAAVAKLSEKNGPVYVNIGAGDLAAFVLDSILHGFSPAASNAEAMARDDHLYLRAQVSVADLGGPKTLGPLSGLLEGTAGTCPARALRGAQAWSRPVPRGRGVAQGTEAAVGDDSGARGADRHARP